MDQTANDELVTKYWDPEYDEESVRRAIEKFREQQNLVGGAAAGFIAALAGAGLWAVITVATGYQIGFMAIGVGFLVGIAIRAMGKGLDKVFGGVGAGLALLGCILGNLFTIVYFVGQAEGMGFFEVLPLLNLAAIPDLMIATFSPMDLVFYAIALYEGYQLSFRQISEDELRHAISGAPVT